jgi:uncharacterized protein
MPADTIQLFDRSPLPEGIRRDGAGNLIVPDAVVARSGIYDYAGFELGKPEMRRVRVFRPPDEVFNRDTMRSLAGVPVTIRHPSELVDTKNWREHAKGETSSDDIVRDGEAVKVPFIVRDEAAIADIEDGLHELSPGYTAVIDWTAGETEQGEAYDAVARNIRYNHLAIVDRARGGSSCRIGDEKPEGNKVSTKIILVDGLQVEVTEAAERAILKLQDQAKELQTKLSDTETKLADAEKAKGTLEGEKAALETKLKDASDPAVLQKAAAERSELCGKAKAIVPNIVTDGKSDADIRKEVVSAKLGDAAKDFGDDQIAGAFATLAAGVKSKGGNDKLTDAIRDGSVGGDELSELREKREKARSKMFDHLHGAHRTEENKE